MLKEILAVSGKPGLYRLVSKGANLIIIESLTDKKRIPAYTRDKIVSLNDISLFTDEGDVSLPDVLTKIKEKEDGNVIAIDVLKANTDELRAYLAEVLPNFDRERVYPSDIRKLLKWYDLLITNEITDFSKKEEEETTAEEEKNPPVIASEAKQSEPDAESDTQKPTSSASLTTKPASSKRKNNSMMSAQAAKATSHKPMPKSATPKKSVVGAKRGG
jgi:hypothetical protein